MNLNIINSKISIRYGTYIHRGVHSVRQAISKVRFLSDTLMTGEKLSLMYGHKPNCFCGYPNEDRFHILLDCVTYSDLREYCIKKIIVIITEGYPSITEDDIKSRYALGHLLLDPSWFRSDIGSPGKGLPNIMSKHICDELEIVTRIYCYQIYRRRFSILSESGYDSNGDTEDEDDYSLHDTSDENTSSIDSWDSQSSDSE